MARYTGSSWKVSRRLGFSVSETGKELAKRPYAPGQHGQRRRKLSEYGLQLQEKQRVRAMYGMTERQFRSTFDRAHKMTGKQGENFLKLLECRLDNVVYRMGLARTRRAARQIVNHGHIVVDGVKTDIPSYTVKPGQVISVREKSVKHPAIVEALDLGTHVLDFVTFDREKMEGSFVRLPERNELNQEVNEQLIVEYYNR